MKSIYSNLYIGDINDYRSIDIDDWAVVSATQTVHYTNLGWDRKYNKPPKGHPNYIKLINDNRFSLNWVDGGAHLYNWTGTDTFIEILDFIEKWIRSRKVLVHCDQGMSRSPTVGLLFLSKRVDILPKNSFVNAHKEFLSIYPNYSPSGIAQYLSNNWNEIQ